MMAEAELLLALTKKLNRPKKQIVHFSKKTSTSRPYQIMMAQSASVISVDLCLESCVMNIDEYIKKTAPISVIA